MESYRFKIYYLKEEFLMKFAQKAKECVKKHKNEIIVGGLSFAAATIACCISYKKGSKSGEDCTLISLGIDPYQRIYKGDVKVAVKELLNNATITDKVCEEYLHNHKNDSLDVKFLFN